MRSTLAYTIRNNASVFDKEGYVKSYEPVITEMGLCLTTSIKYYYQNQQINKSNSILGAIEYCQPMEQCVNILKVPANDGNHIKVVRFFFKYVNIIKYVR